MSTDIIIVSYQDEEPLSRCVASIKEHCTDYTLIIEDNNPPRENRGYSKAVNDGIKRGSSEFLWLLNSDAIVKDAMTQQALIERFSYGSQVGVVGSCQLDYDDPDLIRHCGTLSVLPGRHKGGRVSMGHGQIPEKQKWVNFGSAMIRRSNIPITGLLDETMFLLYSDSTFCYTCREKGLEVWYEPRSRVFHRLNVSKRPNQWHQKDMLAFLERWDIKATSVEGQFLYSPEFQKLDMFP